MPVHLQRRIAPLPSSTPAARSLTGSKPQGQSLSKTQAPEPLPRAWAAPTILPAAHVKIPAGLAERFALALQSQAMPWVESEAVIVGLYAEDCDFRDPVMHFKDRAGFIKYLKFMDEWGKVPRVDISESRLEGKVGHAKGSLYYQPIKGPTIRADFSTRMEFNDRGLIVKHEDHWNVIGSIVSALMGRGKLPPA